MLVMYYTQESRIERMDKLDSLEWDNNGRAQADIKDTQTALHALTEKILKLEFNPASRISKPETP